jgi:phospholipid/cholesterol/gamma-HCH transport system substrate-binding protein
MRCGDFEYKARLRQESAVSRFLRIPAQPQARSMETRANFLVMGLFIGAVVLGAVKFAFFIIGPALTTQRMAYELVVTGPAGGLSQGAEVLFNGLPVGEITQVSLSESEPGKVFVLIEIDKATPVRTNTKARVQMTSLTGYPMISLEGASANAPEIPILPGQRYPRLAIQASATADLLANIQLFPLRLSRTMEKLQDTLGHAPSSLNAIKWNLTSFTDTLGWKPGAQGAPDTPALDAKSAGKSLTTLTTRLDRLIDAANSINNSPELKDAADLSARLKKESSTQLPKLESLAVDARKKVKTLENAIQDMGLTPQSPAPASSSKANVKAPR